MAFHVKLLFALLIGNVILRTFTNGLNVLPKILNVVDIPIVLLIFLLSLQHRGQVERPSWTASITRRMTWFCLVLVLGSVLNYEYFYLPASMSQVIMLLLPLLLFVALVNLPFTPEHVVTYTGVLKKLILLEVVIGVLQLPIRIQTGDTEKVHGTFPGNAEQYAAFLMIASFYWIGIAAIDPQRRRRCILAVILIQVLNISIDNKASWVGAACALGLVFWHLASEKRNLLSLAGVGILVAGIGMGIAFAASRTSTTLYKFELMAEAIRTGQLASIGKIKAYLDIAKSHFGAPHMLLVGAGPSTFYSRGCRQFYLSQNARTKMYVNSSMLEDDKTMARESGGASDSMGGFMAVSLSEPYYSQFYGEVDKIYAVGSIQVDSPFSPYAGLLGETGLLGAWLYLGCYFVAFRRLIAWVPVYRHDKKIFPLLVTALGFMVYLAVNSIYGPFLETTRMTTILWSMVALVSIYVHSAERLSRTIEAATEMESGCETEDPDAVRVIM